MTSTDNAPDSNRDGGEKSFEDFFDRKRLMVRVPQSVYETLENGNELLDLRARLKEWFVLFMKEGDGDTGDVECFDTLDHFLTGLIKPVLHHEFLKSHNNNSTESKQ